MPTTFRILSLNCNGLRAAVRKDLFSFLLDVKPDVICFQETRCDKASLPKEMRGGYCLEASEKSRQTVGVESCDENGFSQFGEHWVCADKKGYSGVGCLSRVAGKAEKISLGHSQLDTEGRLQKLELESLVILNAYFPSGTSGSYRQDLKMAFLPLVTKKLLTLQKSRKPILLLGDFNITHRDIDLKNFKSNRNKPGCLPEEREWLDQLFQMGFQDVVRQAAGQTEGLYSWWSQRSGARDRNVGWRIDYQLLWDPTGQVSMVDYQMPRLPVISDHAPVIVDYKFQ